MNQHNHVVMVAVIAAILSSISIQPANATGGHHGQHHPEKHSHPQEGPRMNADDGFRAKIDDLKGESINGLAQLAEEAGIQIHVSGNGLRGPGSGAFSIYDDGRHWHDFSTGRGGDVIDFIMEYRGLDFNEAMEYLADRAGTTWKKFTLEEELEAKSRRRKAYILTAAFEYMMTAIPAAIIQDLKQARGLTDQDIKVFRLGWQTPELWCHLTGLGFNSEEIRSTGLYDQSDQPLFLGRILIPTIENDRVVQYLGRVTDAATAFDQQIKYKKPSSDALPDEGYLFGIDSVPRATQVVLVEGPYDAIAVQRTGLPAVAIGTSSLNAKQLDRLLKKAPQECGFVVVPDDDPPQADGTRAGKAGAEKTALAIWKAGRTKVFIAELPAAAGGGKQDADSFIRCHGCDRFRTILSQKKPLLEYLLDQINPQLSAVEKAPALKRIAALVPADNALLLEEILYHAKSKLGVGLGALRKVFASAKEDDEDDDEESADPAVLKANSFLKDHVIWANGTYAEKGTRPLFYLAVLDPPPHWQELDEQALLVLAGLDAEADREFNNRFLYALSLRAQVLGPTQAGELASRKVNLANGVLDFRTYTMEQWRPAMKLLGGLPREYWPPGDPRRIHPDDNLVHQFWKAFGPDVYNRMVRWVFPRIIRPSTGNGIIFLIGPAGCGKTTSTSTTIRFLVGSYAELSLAQIEEGKHDMTSWIEVHANLIDEVTVNGLKGCEIVKRIATQSTIHVDPKFKTAITVRCVTTNLIAGNVMPWLPDADEAMFDRLVLVLFTRRFRNQAGEIEDLSAHFESIPVAHWDSFFSDLVDLSRDPANLKPPKGAMEQEYGLLRDRLFIFISSARREAPGHSTRLSEIEKLYREEHQRICERAARNNKTVESETRGPRVLQDLAEEYCEFLGMEVYENRHDKTRYVRDVVFSPEIQEVSSKERIPVTFPEALFPALPLVKQPDPICGSGYGTDDVDSTQDHQDLHNTLPEDIATVTADVSELNDFRRAVVARVREEGSLHVNRVQAMLPEHLRQMAQPMINDLVAAGQVTFDGTWITAVDPEEAL